MGTINLATVPLRLAIWHVEHSKCWGNNLNRCDLARGAQQVLGTVQQVLGLLLVLGTASARFTFVYLPPQQR